MKTQNIAFHVVLLLLITLFSCGPSKQKSDFKETNAGIDGIKDEQGLKKYLETEITSIPKNIGLFDQKLARELGIDLKMINEIEDLVNGINMDIYRIELVPGLNDQSNPTNPYDNFTSMFGSNDFKPNMPSKGSLVSNSLGAGYGYNYRGWVYGQSSGGTATYNDGSTWIKITVVDRDGSTYTQESTHTADGGLIYLHVEEVDSEGNREISHHESEDPAEQNSEAERARRHNEASGGSESSESSEGDEDAGENSGDGEKLDKYQPADGSSANFCPLTLDICRRAVENLIKDQQKVKTGWLIINPGEPDDQPEGQRLYFDPESLVINPAFDTDGSRRIDPSTIQKRIRMIIPIHVNPPGPNEE